jgi:hypothetical protein
MICKTCNKEITKDLIRTISGNVGTYRNKCRICYNKDQKLRYEKRKKALNESRWF